MPKAPSKNALLAGQTGYLVETAKNYLINKNILTVDQLTKGGYEIHTTFQKPKVIALEDAVKKVQKAHIKPGGTHVDKSDTADPDKDKFVQFGGASLNPSTGAIVAHVRRHRLHQALHQQRGRRPAPRSDRPSSRSCWRRR